MFIAGSTRIVGIFGDPVAHSLSPLMQNAALQAAGIDAVYVPFHVTPAQLRDAVQAIRPLGILGVNLTIPHKEQACSLVDELDPAAALIGAVNTIVQRDGCLIGCNTDGLGLLRALREDLGLTLPGKRVLIMGAGGAARAAVAALAQAGAAWIGVVNRTHHRAVELLAALQPKLKGTAFAAVPLTAGVPKLAEGPVDLLVNSTSVGLQGEVFALPLERCVLAGGAVYDMTYGRGPTPLISLARASGLVAADGLGMLAGQGEEAFRLWFEAPAPSGVMRAALGSVRSEK
jgi:shikimate dehydrogenase